MPPRYAYWTILAGGLPTAFRTAEREELLPTFHRIKEKHPDAEMKYFARGKLWESPEQARREAERQREVRARDWRPGGEHRDPRQRFRDAKKARNQDRRQRRWDQKQRDGDARVARPERPHGDPLRRPAAPRGPRRDRGQREQRPWSASAERRPRGKRHGDTLGRGKGAPPGAPRRNRIREHDAPHRPEPPRTGDYDVPPRSVPSEPRPKPSEPVIPPPPPERGRRKR